MPFKRRTDTGDHKKSAHHLAFFFFFFVEAVEVHFLRQRQKKKKDSETFESHATTGVTTDVDHQATSKMDFL